jgi:protein-disulfide isomerase
MAVMSPIPGVGADPAVRDAERSRIEAVVRDYLKQNPDVIIDALKVYEERQHTEMERVTQSALMASREELERDPSSPVAGAPNGDVTVVEFFDYRCGYCKKTLSAVQELLKSDPKIRWVFKELPILGPDSLVAARAGQAAWRIAPEKYLDLHIALMGSRGELSEARVLEIARSVGLDPDKLKKAMDDPEVRKTLQRNAELARRLQINGTPAFVIGDKVAPGALDVGMLRKLVEIARAN